MDDEVLQKYLDAVKTLEREGFIYTSLHGSTHKDWYMEHNLTPDHAFSACRHGVSFRYVCPDCEEEDALLDEEQ